MAIHWMAIHRTIQYIIFRLAKDCLATCQVVSYVSKIISRCLLPISCRIFCVRFKLKNSSKKFRVKSFNLTPLTNDDMPRNEAQFFDWKLWKIINRIQQTCKLAQIHRNSLDVIQMIWIKSSRKQDSNFEFSTGTVSDLMQSDHSTRVRTSESK